MASGGDYSGDPELVRQYAEKVGGTVEWFKSLGIKFTPSYQIYGGLWPRCRNPQGEKGYAYTEAEQKRLEALGVDIKTKHKVVAFVRENPNEGRVVGVVAAAGGFAYNAEMCSYFDPRFTNLSTTNQPGATGEVLVSMQVVGALATGLEYIQCIEYSIFVNKKGRLFGTAKQTCYVIRPRTYLRKIFATI